MLEWLAATASVELGKLVLDQVLNLGKSALEDYVKDFFKDCIKGGIARANAETLKKPMAEAIGFFIKRFVKELQINDVPETSIEHHYKAAIKRFVQNKSVRPILGKAFETHCKQIDYAQLQQIWTQHYQESEWQFPAEEFDWRGVAKEYAFEVKGIIKANAELRSLLEAELLETIAQNTANLNTQISPGFDVSKYRESLQCSYGYLKLYTLDSTDRTDAIKLWNIFIEQTVREALPPMRYELPLDLKRQLQEQGQLEADLSSEALERYRQDYFQQPARKVLEAVAESQWAVILGDPGAGKSTLLQYLALGWVEGQTDALPLLIELREYAIAPVNNFLEFLHCGRGVDWQFDQQQLHQYLQENPALVMFDGLDEVFDRATQAAIMDDIIRFAQLYPKAQIVITSRIIGYNPERLRQAGFQHFTIQPLETDEIHEFIDRWYTLALGNDPDKPRLVTRLKDAIANSKSIQNLADNPLLLTMMAILNRRQELPRDRADLYDQASRVLLYHWDVDHKRLQLPMDAIGRREKQEILRAIAYEMQAGEGGLKGNLIITEQLTQILADYLRGQGFSEPREKANLLIQQLRERNFILCYRGFETYGFVHRTFLEYFCAMEIVHRFEKQRKLTFEQLRDQVFDQHWQDETWHEVLRLICGMIDVRFADELIVFLLSQKLERSNFIEQKRFERFGEKRVTKTGILHILFAAECFAEVQLPHDRATAKLLLQALKKEACEPHSIKLDLETAEAVCDAIAENFGRSKDTREWLKQRIDFNEDYVTLTAAILSVSRYFSNDSETLPWLKRCLLHNYWGVRRAAIWAIQSAFREAPEICSINFCDLLMELAENDENSEVRFTSVGAIADLFGNKPETLQWLKQCIQYSENEDVRSRAVREILETFDPDSEIFDILVKAVQADGNWVVRGEAINQISKHFMIDEKTFELLCKVVQSDPYDSSKEEVKRWGTHPRQAALDALLTHYPTHPKTFELLHDRANTDPDKQMREWARQQLDQL